jgi:antitoxin ParD1/3/4
MNDFHFPADLQPYVDEMMASGKYVDVGQLVEEAVRFHRDREAFRRQKYENLKREIQIGLDEIARGEVVDGEEYFNQLLQRLSAEKREAS